MQHFDSLDYLDNLVNDVFGKIEKKVRHAIMCLAAAERKGVWVSCDRWGIS